MPPSRHLSAQIHIARKDLALTDDAYRDILRLQFNVESSKDLTERQAKALIELFKSKGFRPKQPTKPRKNPDFITVNPGPAAKQQRKILAMWNELGYGMAKLHTRVQTQFGVDRFEWLIDHDDLHILITDLAKRIASARNGKQNRRGVHHGSDTPAA